MLVNPLALSWGGTIVAGHALLLMSGIVTFALLRVLAPGWRVQHRTPRRGVVVHELVYATGTLAIGAAIGITTVLLAQRGWIRFATGAVTPGRVAGEFLAYFVAFDAYFYVVHRLLHAPFPYRWVHAVHHRSQTPTPLTAFSFHPVEAIATGAFLPLMLMAVSFHLTSVLVISAYAGLSSVVVHLGHDPAPTWWYRRWPSQWFVTPAYHDRHHASGGRWHFGGYTTIWDRIFGTDEPGFDGREVR
ncbi:MAG TPA: sterol desaturase family protein [Candidatus Binatia bacterium]|jgi:sterol desaturase/sphingolipid hydroxylase (fatty acid hydroxylase superfamily)|nr:sterol desaturase family protein [Candidatus Binatia bacterium]